MSHETNALAQIHRQIMWNRLIAVVEEQAQIMIRTAFSTTVREAGDLSAGIFDLHGRMMAQAVTGTPGHVNSMAESRRALPAEIPHRHDARGRPLHHQRPLARHRPSARPDRRHPGVPQRPHRRAVRQHRARHRHRRPRHGARGPLGVRGRPVHPDHQMLRPGPAERNVLRLHPRRLAPAGGTGRRHLLAVRLQRRRRRTGWRR